MIKCFSKVAIVLAAALLLLPAQGQAAKKISIKVGHGLTEFSAMHHGWVKFKEELEKSSPDFDVQIYPNQQVGGDREMTEAVQLGSLTMTSPSSSPLAAFEKDFFILDAPFLFANRADVFAALDGEMGQALYAKLPAISLIGLAYWENGFRNLTNSRNEVRTPEEVKGLKLRTMENAIHLAAWKAMGANPTPMAFGELFTALQQKTVDGQENPFGQIFDNKFYEVQPYITRSQHVYTPFTVITNDEWWNDLSDEQRNKINAAMKVATDFQRKTAEELDDKAADNIKAANREIVELTADQLAAFRKAAAPVAEEIKARVSPEAFKLYNDYMNSK